MDNISFYMKAVTYLIFLIIIHTSSSFLVSIDHLEGWWFNPKPVYQAVVVMAFQFEKQRSEA